MPTTHDSKPFSWRRGPLTVALESVFWHPQKYPSRAVAPVTPPLSEVASPRELEDPFRVGHGRVFRIPLTRRAVVLGWWEPADPTQPVLEEEEGAKLLGAVEGAMIPGITATEISDWARARDWGLLARVMRWLAARFPALARETGAVADVHHLVQQPAVDRDPRVIEWDDSTPIIDLEDARVSRSIVLQHWDDEEAVEW